MKLCCDSREGGWVQVKSFPNRSTWCEQLGTSSIIRGRIKAEKLLNYVMSGRIPYLIKHILP